MCDRPGSAPHCTETVARRRRLCSVSALGTRRREAASILPGRQYRWIAHRWVEGYMLRQVPPRRRIDKGGLGAQRDELAVEGDSLRRRGPAKFARLPRWRATAGSAGFRSAAAVCLRGERHAAGRGTVKQDGRSRRQGPAEQPRPRRRDRRHAGRHAARIPRCACRTRRDGLQRRGRGLRGASTTRPFARRRRVSQGHGPHQRRGVLLSHGERAHMAPSTK